MTDLRQAGRILRFHTVPTIKTQTVAEHSHGVAMLLYKMYGDKIRPELLMAALTHDLAEIETGDVPAHAKRASADLKVALDAMETVFNHEHSIQFEYELTLEELQLLQIADTLELVEFCLDEIQLGNTGSILNVLERGKEYLRNHASVLQGCESVAASRAYQMIKAVCHESN